MKAIEIILGILLVIVAFGGLFYWISNYMSNSTDKVSEKTSKFSDDRAMIVEYNEKGDKLVLETPFGYDDIQESLVVGFNCKDYPDMIENYYTKQQIQKVNGMNGENIALLGIVSTDLGECEISYVANDGVGYEISNSQNYKELGGSGDNKGNVFKQAYDSATGKLYFKTYTKENTITKAWDDIQLVCFGNGVFLELNATDSADTLLVDVTNSTYTINGKTINYIKGDYNVNDGQAVLGTQFSAIGNNQVLTHAVAIPEALYNSTIRDNYLNCILGFEN